MFERILTWMNHNSDHVKATSKEPYSHHSLINFQNDKKIHYEKTNWSSRSGMYQGLTDQQKRYLEKVNKILDEEERNDSLKPLRYH